MYKSIITDIFSGNLILIVGFFKKVPFYIHFTACDIYASNELFTVQAAYFDNDFCGSTT